MTEQAKEDAGMTEGFIKRIRSRGRLGETVALANIDVSDKCATTTWCTFSDHEADAEVSRSSVQPNRPHSNFTDRS